MPRGRRERTEAAAAEREQRRARLGRAIAARRRELGISQTQLAAAFGLRDTSVHKIENGKQSVQLLDVIEWATILRVEPIWFVDRQVRD